MISWALLIYTFFQMSRLLYRFFFFWIITRWKRAIYVNEFLLLNNNKLMILYILIAALWLLFWCIHKFVTPLNESIILQCDKIKSQYFGLITIYLIIFNKRTKIACCAFIPWLFFLWLKSGGRRSLCCRQCSDIYRSQELLRFALIFLKIQLFKRSVSSALDASALTLSASRAHS